MNKGNDYWYKVSAVITIILNCSGQLLMQCGGYGNLQEFIRILERITHLESDSKNILQTGSNHGNLPGTEDTNKLLQEIGNINTTVYSSSDSVILQNRQIYSKFIKAEEMKTYLDHLSQDNYDK